MTNTEALKVTVPKANPFISALGIISSSAFLIAIIFGIWGAALLNSYSDAADAPGVLVWAGIFTQVAAVAGLLWILANALTWKPRS